MKRISISEAQYDGVLKRFEDNGHNDNEIKAVENDRLSMELVDTKQKSRESIDDAFKLGIKYARAKKDLYLKKEIKKKLDDMIQALDDIG